MKLNVVWRWGGGKGEDRADLPDVVSRTGRGGCTTSGTRTFRDDYQGVHLCSPSSPLRELSRQVTFWECFLGAVFMGGGVSRGPMYAYFSRMASAANEVQTPKSPENLSLFFGLETFGDVKI
jgi:hypothetical protein